MNRRSITVLVTAGLLLLGSAGGAAAADVSGLLKIAGFRGGLVVQVGCADGKALASLGAGGPLLVQGLCADASKVGALREQVRSAGGYGRVTVRQYDGRHLPYVDELVNALVISQARSLEAGEVLRVVAPGGVVLVKTGVEVPGLKAAPLNGATEWGIFSKPRPKRIDEWTHYLHDPQGTSVSRDELAGYPRGLRWTGGPLWTRSHEHTSGLNAMVSAAGRVFYVMDEGLTDSIQLPAENYLTARDAFSGVVLWKHRLRWWHNHLYPLKSGPGWLPRRLVAVGERVWIAPGVGEELLCLEAATGKVLHKYAGTASTFEFIVSDGVIFAAVDPNARRIDYRQENSNCWREQARASRRWAWRRETGRRVLKAIDASNGKVLWELTGPATPMTLAADGRMVCFHDGEAVVALDRRTGKRLWRAEDVADVKMVPTGYGGPRLVLCGERVVFSPYGSISVIDAGSGKVLWTVKGKPRSGHFSLEDFYVLGDKIWVLQRTNKGGFNLYDLADGSLTGRVVNPISSFYIHQRCYPGRATTRLLLPPIMGIQVYDLQKDRWENNHWIRGACVYGVMPANGMVYATPHACACYYQSKLNGFNAVAPEASPSQAPALARRLVKGPAYGKVDRGAAAGAEDWPVFRHDNTRSGYVRTDVPAAVRQAWSVRVGTKLSQPVVAAGRLLLSAVDEHTVYALDAATGRELWHFIAGGRVNSPPTLWGGLAVFGCADGWVYALRARDGALAWRFQAAPNDRQVFSFGQLESVWPLPGSVLIQAAGDAGERLYCVAGRSMFLDGGLRMVVLNPTTGELLAENVMDRHVPGTNKDLQELLMGKHMPVAMPDILSSDGKRVYMKSQVFDFQGRRTRVRPLRPDTQYDEEVHLFSPISFLDDSWHQRTYWIFGRAAGEGWAEFQFPPKRVPCGRILCIDEKNAYSYGRDPELLCNTSVTEYRLFSAEKYPKRKVGIPRLEGTWVKGRYPTDKANLLVSNSVEWKTLAKLPPEKLSALTYNWVREEPDVMAKAMVLAGERLFLAGPRDVVDEKSMWGRSNEKLFQEKMRLQADHLKGAYGAVMQVFSKTDGRKLGEQKLDYMPVFDGLIAAGGRLYMVTRSGSVLCFEGR